MRKHFLVVLLMILVISFAATVQADTIVRGRLMSVGPGFITIQLYQGPTMTFLVSNFTQVQRNGKGVGWDGLRGLDRVSLLLDNNRNVVAIDARSRRGN